jgi:hypothetical protein
MGFVIALGCTVSTRIGLVKRGAVGIWPGLGEVTR